MYYVDVSIIKAIQAQAKNHAMISVWPVIVVPPSEIGSVRGFR